MKITALAFALIITVLCFSSAHAQPVSGSGKQTMEAVAPTGQFIGFRYEAKGQMVFGGLRVKKLVWEWRAESKDPNAKQFLFVHELNLVNNKLEYAYGPKDKTVSGETAISDVDYSSGHIVMTVANLPFSEPNTKYKLTLTSPIEGTIKPATSQKGNVNPRKRAN